MTDNPRYFGELASLALVAGALSKFMPALAAALGLWWYGICIWESRTGRFWRERWYRLFVAIRTRQFTAEDRLIPVVLGLSGAGVGLTFLALQVLLGSR